MSFPIVPGGTFSLSTDGQVIFTLNSGGILVCGFNPFGPLQTAPGQQIPLHIPVVFGGTQSTLNTVDGTVAGSGTVAVPNQSSPATVVNKALHGFISGGSGVLNNPA